MKAHASAHTSGPLKTWIECSFEVEGRRIGVSVRQLDVDERRRVGLEIAWFAEGLRTPGVDVEATGWPALLAQILSCDVAITFSEDRPTSDDFWNQVVCRTLELFMKANQLRPSLGYSYAQAHAPK